MPPRVNIQPSLETVQQVLSTSKGSPKAPNLVPLCASIPADLLTPSLAYLKVSAQKVLKTGLGHGPECDPLPLLEEELSQFRVATIPGLILPPLAGGAIGYVGYDCVRYFEPRTARPLKDILRVPESLFMLFNTIIAFDHFYQVIKVVTYLSVPSSFTLGPTTISSAYDTASATLSATIATLLSPDIPLPPQPPITPNQHYTSNIGQSGYETHVRTLKRHITSGNIIQAVPSQRFSRPTSLHPFNIYRHLRTVNPSPYLFYIDCGGAFQLVGASPELLVKSEKGRIITHPIAGTVKRGASPEADEALANELRTSLKDRAEHVMLVDLARNDVNRVCDPLSTTVDRLMVVEKFSHVQHLVSQVSGVLRKGRNRFDAFRSIFPAGTVSGAPKVRAMELIAELEREKRGVYAGAVGYFGYGRVRFDGIKKDKDGVEAETGMVEEEGAMDTCIALRTMLVKDGVAYLQAGGGIVFDSDPYEEWVETMNKLGANMQCIASAEERYARMDDEGGDAIEADGETLGEDSQGVKNDDVKNTHVDMAAG
ncbi:hypothetical protein MMC08_004033 [Hypocenomyce scalaris]|nr:hypothetical protein [Hypocenomyce scalaris]